jgi:hypothetical protein
MSVFIRGIENQKFIAALNNNLQFQKLIIEEELFIAIRNEYISVYYLGQTICEVRFTNNVINWKTHYKYLNKEILDKCLGKIRIDKYHKTSDGEYLDDIKEIKNRAKEKGGIEKEQVTKHILMAKKLMILDVEITFGKEDGYSRRSIDYLTLEKNENDKFCLVFYEAKHFKNPEIRAKIKEPKVFCQIKNYKEALNNTLHQIEIINSYKTVYKNILELNLNVKSRPEYLTVGNAVSFEIDSQPRLIIFGVEPNKRNDIHIKKLKEELGNDRVITHPDCP